MHEKLNSEEGPYILEMDEVIYPFLWMHGGKNHHSLHGLKSLVGL